MTMSLRKQSGRSLWRNGCVCAACVALGSAAGAQDFADDTDSLEGQVEVSEFLTVDLHVQDTDLAKVLQMLSIQSQKNIIMTKNVSGTVTAHLYDVTFYEALDSILNANGFGYLEEGNFIKVYTLEELAQIEQAARELVHERFELSYLNASDAAIFVTPLLSEEGSIAINGEAPTGFDPDEGDGGSDSWAFSATLIVSDYPENVERIAALLDELDTRPRQVLVEATVLQTTLTEDNAWGVDWSIVGDIDFLDFSNPLSGVDDMLAGSSERQEEMAIPSDNDAWNVRSNAGQTSGPGTLKLGVVSNDISVFMRVLDEVSDTTIVSRPRVLTLNRQRGEILIGRRIGYISTTSTETSTTQTVEFLDTGTQLIFRPFVGKDGFIRMELKPSISEGVIRDVTGPDGGNFTIPDEITQELTTNVVVRDGHTIVLGGLFKEETTLTRRQVPVLGDIPLVGAAFRGHDDNTRRSEITFLITPSIMNDEVLTLEGEAAMEAVEEIRIGARKGVLPWSIDRLTSQHNMKAEEALRAGDTEMALWHIDQSLNLKKNQPLVYRMREDITGNSVEWFNGQMFDRMLEGFAENGVAEAEGDHGMEAELIGDPLAQEFGGEKAEGAGSADEGDAQAQAQEKASADAEQASAEDSDELLQDFEGFEPEAGFAEFANDGGDSPTSATGNANAGGSGDGEGENPAQEEETPAPADEPQAEPAPDQSMTEATGEEPSEGTDEDEEIASSDPAVAEAAEEFKQFEFDPNEHSESSTDATEAGGADAKPEAAQTEGVAEGEANNANRQGFDSNVLEGELRFLSDASSFDVDGDPFTPGTLVGRWHWLQRNHGDAKDSVEFAGAPADGE